MPSESLYDTSKTYYQNLQEGPFGSFGSGKIYHNSGEPRYDFFGVKVYAPFGIAAGPLPGARFVKAAFDKGFDIVTFKSVRTHEYPCHSVPNILPLNIRHLDPIRTDEPIHPKNSFAKPLSLANSFGIPSSEPQVWQPEIKQAFSVLQKGQAMLTAFQGTDRGKGQQAFIDDHALGVRLLKEAGARIIEINLSCPNQGNAALLCFDAITTQAIMTAIRQYSSDIRLLVKITYFPDQAQLKEFVIRVGPLVDGITAINTIGCRVVDAAGKQAFPGGADRSKPGISGHAIKQAGIDMVTRLAQLRGDLGLRYKIVGVGGVLDANDFKDYRNRGADIVMSVTGAMWNPDLAAEIKAAL